MDRRFVSVQVFNEGPDAALVLEQVLLVVALIVDADAHSLGQEGELAQSLAENVEAELGRLEDLAVWLERDLGALPLRTAPHRELGRLIASLVVLLVVLTAAEDLDCVCVFFLKHTPQ